MTSTIPDDETVSLISSATTFFSLPIELRNIIYSLILIPSHNINICSPPGKYLGDREGRRWPRPRKGFVGQLLLVNRQFYKEASYLFYSKSTFALGCGLYSSTTAPNLHRLKCFLQRVPQEHTDCITKLKVLFVLDWYY